MTLEESERDPSLDTVAVVVPDGHLSSNRDRRLCQKVLARVALRITEEALRANGWRLSGGQFRARAGRVTVRARVTRLGTHLAITWTFQTERRVLARQSVPIASRPELYEGSLIARARLVGVFMAGALLTPIAEDAVQHSRLGHQLSGLGSKMIDSVEDVAVDAARSALAELGIEGRLHRRGNTLEITLPPSGPRLREEEDDEEDEGEASTPFRGRRPTKASKARRSR